MPHLALAACLAALQAAQIPLDPPGSLRLILPAGYLPGTPVLVRAELERGGVLARDVWDAEVDLSVAAGTATVSPEKIHLWNGVGSALVTISGNGPLTLRAAWGPLVEERSLVDRSGDPVQNASGNLQGPVAEWSGVIHVTSTVTVPAGVTLRLVPGTIVLVDGVAGAEGQPGVCKSVAETPTLCGNGIHVQGKVEALGTEDDPIVITASNPTRAWGEIHHDGAAPSVYDFTLISRAGHSPRGGHTSTGPAIRATGSKIRLEGCALSDTAGKSMQARDSDLEIIDTLLTRSIMGPEIEGTSLLFERSYSLELHGTDDNDGIYLHDQHAGQVIALRQAVVASGDDDGIDTLGSNVTIEDVIVRDFANPNEDSKGISVFSGEVTVTGCLLADNKVGITAKSQNGGSATVHVSRSTIVDCTLIGLQAQDKFDEPDLRIRFFVTSSIVRAPDAVQTDYPNFPNDLRITYSDLSEAWTGTGNITDSPAFVAPGDHNYALSSASPCIDTGDPALPPDPDGSRSDMGAIPYAGGPVAPRFVRGRVNADASVDISDAVSLLLHLFVGGEIGCPAAADTNDDSSLNLSDAVYLLDFLFRGGVALPAPQGSCAPDPTPDDLECPAPTCG